MNHLQLETVLVVAVLGNQCHSMGRVSFAETATPLKLSASAPTGSRTSGEFEGDYKIGNMICTVYPIKMAFEIKCANQPGTVIFFGNGLGEFNPQDATFVSQEKAGKRSSIKFDDEDYNNGVFVAPDGSRFPIQRVRKAVPQDASSTH